MHLDTIWGIGCLKAAEIMTSSFRDEDIISRVGGDEFVILLPTTMEKTALKL